MKKTIITLGLILVTSLGFSQSIFDKFEDYDNVTNVIVNKNMFNLLNKIEVNTGDPEAQDFIDITKSLSGLKVFITEDKEIASEMKTTVDKYLKSSKLEELMRVKDEDTHVKFYIREGKDEDHVSELLMFVTGIKDVDIEGRKIETVLLTLTGDIDLNKISSLTNRMNLPEELNKADKNN